MFKAHARSNVLYSFETVYFADNYREHASKADFIRFVQSSDSPRTAQPFHTLHIDLTRDPGILLAEMDRHTRQYLKQSVRSDEFLIHMEDPPDNDTISHFYTFSKEIREVAGLPGLSPDILRDLASAGALAISCAFDRDGTKLCCHSHIYDQHRARALHSISLCAADMRPEMRTYYGRANRMLHWSDMLHFKSKGIRIYDFGGITPDTDDIKLRNITRFKMDFGGEQVTEYNFIFPRTLKAKLLIHMKTVEKRL